MQWQNNNFPRLIGREAWLKQLLGDISAPVTRAVQVVAAQGMGASALLRYVAHPDGLWKNASHRQFVARPFRQPDRLRCVYVDMKLFTPGRSLAAWLCQTLSTHPALQPYFPAGANCDAIPVLPIVDAIAELERREARVVLLLDHLDRALRDLPHDQATQLRPLAGRAVIVTVTEQPLMRLNPDSAASWLGTSQHTVRLGLCELTEAHDLLRLPVPNPQRAPTSDDMRHLLELTGLAPALILRGAVEWWNVRERYGRALDSQHLFEFLRARLREAFWPDFVRYWKSLRTEETQALEWAVRHPGAPPAYLVAPLDELWLSGLLDRDRSGTFRPFSQLWQAYIQERMSESQAEAELRPALSPSLRGRGFTSRDAALLAFLRARPNQVLAYHDIVRAVWQLDTPEDGLDALRMAVNRLRKTLAAGNAPDEIVNHRNRGYEYRRLTHAHPTAP